MGGDFGIFPGHDLRRHIHQRNLTAEARKSLGKLAANWSRAHDQQAGRKLTQIPEILGGQVILFVQPRNGRHEWAARLNRGVRSD